ncbi:MAG: tRNA glutamyl-Q(34) synthetase GluQRS [Deltaproteobacteria bacterium]|nr:tRNA glutamyl-Q(34) synthetase GluQRS [Deltaproteobacteria bacterium]
MNPADGIVGRFAPSPTGALHTGSLVAAVGSYLMAKHAGGRWLLRLDDLDKPRQVAGMADDIMRTLESFGLLWDGEVARQSCNPGAYREAFETLQQSGVVFPCCCSRREIALAASAPHLEDDGLPYPGTCRAGMRQTGIIRSWRVSAPAGEICFHDLCQGSVCQNIASVCGDFAVRRGDGEFAYQLAVVVDDHLAGVNQVVRGADLLTSTPRQIHIQNVLGYQRPVYCHLPLVTGPGGTKLSKRDNLVSQQLGNLAGSEGQLLCSVLSFLGQNPPVTLQEGSCPDILEWGVRHFEAGRIPAAGGEIIVQ